MVVTMPMTIIHFKELFLEVVAIIYIDASNNGKLNQYRGDTLLKTKSFKESIDKG
jgi:hypothetical protein